MEVNLYNLLFHNGFIYDTKSAKQQNKKMYQLDFINRMKR
jgi:hypothetical protein